MKSIIFIAMLMVITFSAPGDDCVVYAEPACKETSRCKWQTGQCYVAINTCEGATASICNAVQSCFLYNGSCLSTGCESQYSSLDCLKQNQYNPETMPCKWLADEERCVARDTCEHQYGEEGCKSMSSQGCRWAGGKCKVTDPCAGKVECINKDGDLSYKCYPRPGFCKSGGSAFVDVTLTGQKEE